jgi:hypothetical protein
LSDRRTAAERVNLGVVHIANLKCLAWWVRDHQKRGLVPAIADWNAAALDAARIRKRSESHDDGKESVSLSNLDKFDPLDFEKHDKAFLNLLSTRSGNIGESIRYVVRDDTPPNVFVNETERRMYQFPLHGVPFAKDNAQVYRLLNAFLINTPGHCWIEEFDRTEDGRGAYMAWTTHYNGRGKLNKRLSHAKNSITNLYYKQETSLSFERVVSILKDAFIVLNKDPDERYSNRSQVEKLLECIQTTHPELVAHKAIITRDFANDFDGACNYYSAQVTNVFKISPGSDKKRTRRFISSAQGGGRFIPRGGGRGGHGGRGGRGRGRSGGRGGRSSRGGYGGRGHGGRSHYLHGVDITNPNRNFSSEEWNKLRDNNALSIIHQLRGERGQQQNGNNNDDQRNVNSLGSNQQQQQDPDSQVSGGSGRGSEVGPSNGNNFGRNAHGGRGGRSGGRLH